MNESRAATPIATHQSSIPTTTSENVQVLHRIEHISLQRRTISELQSAPTFNRMRPKPLISGPFRSIASISNDKRACVHRPVRPWSVGTGAFYFFLGVLKPGAFLAESWGPLKTDPFNWSSPDSHSTSPKSSKNSAECFQPLTRLPRQISTETPTSCGYPLIEG